ncbi:hypothetical protein COCNU_scaffold001460G000010 [Cocos nucifera]|nr:hypothetical protein [Cocos nucifera]
MSLLTMAHDITILYDALNGFARLNSELNDKAQTANARAKSNLGEEFGKLKTDFQKEMEWAESTLAKERNKGAKLVKKLSSTESVTETQAQEAASQALAKFWESKEYEEELSMNSMGVY